jgi:NAD(P)-dependent dehydrogenase (short-subunit alcohol dehydrogenase family)
VRRVLVTGASRGIGGAVAALLAGRGDEVWMVARDGPRLEAAAAAIGVDPRRAIAVDLAHAEAPERVATALGEVSLDWLVCAAGIVRRAPLGAITRQDFVEQLEVNLIGPVLLTQALAPRLADGASIVHVSSNLAGRAVPARIAYSASKAGLEAAVRGLAQELAPRRIRVNALALGAVLTDMMAGVPLDMLERVHPLGVGRPEDAAAACVALLDAPWTTGATLLVDGGAGVHAPR